MQDLWCGKNLKDRRDVMSVIRPKRKYTRNRMFVDSIFISYFLLLVIYIMNQEFFGIDWIDVFVQWVAIGLVVVIAGVIVYKIVKRVMK